MIAVRASGAGASAGASTGTRRARQTLWLIVWLLLAGWLAYSHRFAAADDVYIVHRYVLNLLEGHGWVYNVGEPVQGSTSPANTLALLVAALLCGRDYDAAHALVYAIAIGCACWFVQEALRRLDGAVTAVVCALFVLSSPVLVSTIGLESCLLVLAMCAGFWALVTERPVLAAAAVGCLTLVRPEGVLFGLVLLADVARKRHERPLASLPWGRMVAVAAAPMLVWCAFSIWQFGSPLPSTLEGKQAQAASGWWGTGDLYWRGLRRSFAALDASGWLVSWLGDDKPVYRGLLGGAVVLWLGLLVRPHRALVFVGFAVLHTAAYTALNVPYYHWYGAPVHLAFAIALGIWLGRLHGVCTRRGNARLAALVTATATVLLLLLFGARPWGRAPHYPHYERAAEFVAARAPDDASVGTVEIGVLGLALWPRPIVDAAGLVHPDGPANLRAGRLGWWIEDEAADWIIAHDPLWSGFEAEPLERAVAAGRYVRVDDGAIARIRVYRRSP